MKLYYFPLSTYAQKVLIALYEKNIEFASELVDLRDDQQRAEYRKLYPLGKVPLLVLNDGHMIPESTIIIEYLDNLDPDVRRLIPEDAVRGRQTRFHDRMYDLYLNESVANLIFEGWKPEAKRNQKLIDNANFRIGVMYDYMSKQLADRTWTMGDQFTLADCAAAPPLFYANDVAPFDAHPNIGTYWQRLSMRPSVQKVLKEIKPYLNDIR